MKFLFLMLAALFLAGCRTPAFEPSPEDKLTDRERFALYDYARYFIRKSKKIHLTPEDRAALARDPNTKIRYTGHKKGRVILSWLVPGKKQFIVIATGPLRLEKRENPYWELKVVNYSRSGSTSLKRFGISE